MKKDSVIFVAGHKGLVGSAICRALKKQGFKHIITRNRDECDLRNEHDVNKLFTTIKPDYVFLAAAKVGGILANATYPAEFIYENLMIQTTVIHQSYRHNVKKLLFLGSSCIYPKNCPQPIKEDYLLTNTLEPTNEPYAIAKIAGIKQCQAYNKQYGTTFISAMPTNLYGPNDNYNLQTSHVIPALIKKFVDAVKKNDKTVSIWGTGNAMREFLHVDDCANACLFLMKHYTESQVINIGTGNDIPISKLATTIKDITEYNGNIDYDSSKPDGTPRKVLDITKITALGWQPAISLRNGLTETIKEYQKESVHN